MSILEHWSEWLEIAVAKEASDLHLSPDMPPMMRVMGELQATSNRILTEVDCTELCEGLLSPQQWQQFVIRGDVDAAIQHSVAVRIRLHVYRMQGCPCIAARIVLSRTASIDSLGLPETTRQLIHKKQGLVLVVGPTGSGKSTTLGAFVNELNRTKPLHIVTLEDPVEKLHRSKQGLVHQREIGVDTPTFYDGLRAALRQDPDIIVIGEMRDNDTISTALTAAETGHLVFGTLHTSNAAMAIDRLIDSFPGETQPHIRSQLASVLVGVVAQRLVRRQFDKGMIGIFELLVNIPAVAHCIRSGRTHQLPGIMLTSRSNGMITFSQAFAEAAASGLIAYDTIQSDIDRGGELEAAD
ncbi:type IV pilus twitching motility protein PilT [Paenibacillus apiarius]|uniref:PilT/PilU family type 4a pilus ATPase n=1 Tax=Paenibacillus apiarius TaxID=46240 RepID=A0ABT4DM74_9BACL|nr:PilT/PilU family type 4a pilus ATPase [Paenibacillus apiarius]MCY9516087.1 PilT/PilU family type 4a pilus ATPase [Paenibacillus apiarius]MCY9518454.1 PilT/PilU family type 4a pilus ATPase [Paenibacillus apiarius]MCY9551145.1 PilT/PilU family type 4a pilus ATPase [Paenibacillus apiarius]MCY9558299.1 PilT/PilU family type 4a pilus ATPase [Paenibacillus apiarius]MCY9684699.1 PilT/PilU family type 4a pilus ATPase [Paenibacillus apiarius]